MRASAEILEAPSSWRPLAEYLRVVAPHAPPELVPSADLHRVLELGQSLPSASAAGFEVTLGPRPEPVDFAIRFKARELHLGAWRQMTRLGRADEPQAMAAWRRITELLLRCSADGPERDAALDRLHDFWLEFDADERAGVPLPSIFCGLARWPRDAAWWRAGTPPWVREALRALAGDPSPPLGALDRAYRCLEAPAHLYQVGLMLSRPARGVRVVISQLPSGGASAYLRRVGWPGALDDVRDAIAWLEAAGLRVDLSLDLAAEVQPRLGLELCLPEAPLAGPDPRWARALAACEERGLCTAGQAAALLRWPGCDDPSSPEWPASLRMRARPGFGVPVLARALNHMKLVLQPDGGRALKAYFGFKLMLRHKGRLR